MKTKTRSTKHHYFVVVATQDDDGLWSFNTDDYTLNARFTDGPVWDETTEKWEYPSGETEKTDWSLIRTLWKKLL